MTDPARIRQEINSVIRYLIECGLSDDQNFAIQKDNGRYTAITFPNAEHVTVALRNRSYSSIYEHFAEERAFNTRLPDGGLLQMMYSFQNGVIEQHRLAFFPSPYLAEFQNNPELYMEELIFAEVVALNIVPFPVRFDFDSREEVFEELHHPRSHMTLGQYENCRIPVSAPLTPIWFTDFILRNFYHTAFLEFASSLPKMEGVFAESLAEAEGKVIHLRVPGR